MNNNNQNFYELDEMEEEEQDYEFQQEGALGDVDMGAQANDRRTQIVDDFSPVVDQRELSGPDAGPGMDPVSFRQVEPDGLPSDGMSQIQ